MPRPRKNPKRTPSGGSRKPSAGKSRPNTGSASSSWQRRNERARSLGYRSYYDYRLHDYGRRPPSAPVVASDRARLRGHASQADLLRSFKAGSLVGVEGIQHDKQGKLVSATVLVTDEYGRSKRFVLKGKQLRQANLDKISEAAVAADAVVSPGYGLEQISKADG